MHLQLLEEGFVCWVSFAEYIPRTSALYKSCLFASTEQLSLV